MFVFNQVDLLQERIEGTEDHLKFQVAVQGDVPLSELRNYKLMELKYFTEQDIYSGFHSESLSKYFDYKSNDQMNFSTMVTFLNLEPTTESVEWPTKEGEMLTLAKEEFLSLYKEATIAKNKKLKKYNMLKEQVSSATKKELEKIVW